jgi:hypothetical protein
MKKSEKFEWTSEAKVTFDKLKKVLSTSPILVTPHDRQPMVLYIIVTYQVFITVLIIEHEEAEKFTAPTAPSTSTRC